MSDEGLRKLEREYHKDPSTKEAYIRGLEKTGAVEEALRVLDIVGRYQVIDTRVHPMLTQHQITGNTVLDYRGDPAPFHYLFSNDRSEPLQVTVRRILQPKQEASDSSGS